MALKAGGLHMRPIPQWQIMVLPKGKMAPL
jgi:hypothetical protein